MAQGIYTKFKKTGSTENLLCSGCPKKTTDHEERLIMRNALADRHQPFSELAKLTVANISTSTVRTILVDKGYHQRVVKKVPYLTKAHKKARMAWA